MALPLSIQRISDLNSDKFYEFTAFISIKNFEIINDILKKCTVTLLKKEKFVYNIPDVLTNDKGIYLFTLEELSLFQPNLCYLLYVGRVFKDNTFKNRFYDYRNAIGNENVPQNKMLLTNLWPGKTFVYFYALTDDNTIHDIEQILVNQTKPPFNAEYYTEKTINNIDLYKLA
jgi:hypothetical protein